LGLQRNYWRYAPEGDCVEQHGLRAKEDEKSCRGTSRPLNRYLDGFRKNDHEQILSCLTHDIEWTVFGAFHLTGTEAYDKAIDGAPEFIDPPELEVVRLVEQDDTIMAELKGTARRATGGEMRMSMAELFVMRDGKIVERRAWVIPLNENEYR
jgi:ketosteroid isomerase-like protein